jgi:putative flippase GtrA
VCWCAVELSDLYVCTREMGAILTQVAVRAFLLLSVSSVLEREEAIIANVIGFASGCFWRYWFPILPSYCLQYGV